MRVMTSGLVVLGLIGALSTAPQQADAQEAYIYGPGVSVEIGTRPYGYRHYHRHYWRHRYYDEPYGAYYYAPSYSYYGYYGARERCEPGYTWRNGACRP
jgi:hypothetical protein